MLQKKLLTFLAAAILIVTAATQTTTAAFSDVPTNHPYKTEIDFCQAKGYMIGVNDATFLPEGNLTRAQLAVVWCRLLMLRDTNAGFSDISQLKNYYDTAVIVMNSLGILGGTGTAKFSPDANLTREQLAIITARTFNLGVANANDYQKYADDTLISDWAQDAVSACVNAKVFEGLYDGQSFSPQALVTRAEICRLIYTVSLPTYTVTIGPLLGGTIIALPSVAREGTIVNLIIKADTGKQLKQGSLKYNDTPVDGTSFIMPGANVVITAEFENIPVQLESITVTTPPSVATYFVGDALDLNGLVVTALYNNSTSAVVSGYTTNPAAGSILDTEGSKTIAVSYTEGGITKTTTFDIQVNANP